MPISSGLNQFKNLGKIQNSSTQDEVRKLQGSILSARVRTINQEGKGNDGVISIELLTEVGSSTTNIINNVLPLIPGQKKYPLVNEVVMVIALANTSFSNNFNKLSYYYIPLNIWNSQETNPLPIPNQNVKSLSQNKGYLETQAGNPNKPDSQLNTTFKPGTYFVEKGTINPLYAFEGDAILEGRFGNNIRLGNTVPNNIATLNNNWSTTGSIGDPITIISNGLHSESPTYNSITENINQDKSSIYLTSTQQIPIGVSSQNSYLSYKGNGPTTPNTYTGEQIILNSGRLLFNSTQDHILLSSKKSINLNTVESVNIDAATQTVIQTPELYLGGIETAQPVVLGNDLVNLLKKVLTDLEYLTGTLQNQLGVPVGTPIGPTNLVAQSINSKIGGYKAELSNILSNTTKTV